MKKIIFFFLLVVFSGFVIFMILGPYLRGLQFENQVQIEAMPTSYHCADGNCIGFIVRDISPSALNTFVGKMIIPYSNEIEKDWLQEQWIDLLNRAETSVCITGYLHEYSIGTLRLPHPADGAYRLELSDLSKKSC